MSVNNALNRNLAQLGALACDWPAPPNVCAWITTRRNGLSIGSFGNESGIAGLNLGLHCGDEPAAALANRQLLQNVLSVAPRWLNQVHSDRVIQMPGRSPVGVASPIEPADESTANEPMADVPTADVPTADEPAADASITSEPGLVLGVLSADCLPVFLSASDGSAVGICHAGWRGMAANVIESCATQLRTIATPSASILAHLGPAIGPGFFEVGADVHDAFCRHDAQARSAFIALPTAGKYLANLFELAKLRLQRIGITQVSGGRFCTYRDQQLFYSHRRDRRSGRMASLIWISG